MVTPELWLEWAVPQTTKPLSVAHWARIRAFTVSSSRTPVTGIPRIQETGLYFNHAIVNPPIDRHLPTDKVKDVYIKLEKETDAGIIVSGAKVVATNSALTHYNMIGFGSAQVMGENPDFALMFVAPMDADGVKLISRASYEMVAGATGSPYDYPLSSRFDENDAILVMDNVLIPWENVLIYRDFDRCRRWTMEGGFCPYVSAASLCAPGSETRLHYGTAEKITRMYRHPGVPWCAGRSR
ncbi:4-hydroxyphenylacetate 3-monooxygenase oxygenase component [Escherichia coli]|uniref:4-hydroxyphenylacetate 3-monooxygenase oxygenase component n=1 Tax=Escherichia coli TaxID=562 RepID=A0A2X1N595_ECOLX|nr:4-hydroxyphenylacetate 3-monooxygenase oxygenase component [Escherichia coli]